MESTARHSSSSNSSRQLTLASVLLTVLCIRDGGAAPAQSMQAGSSKAAAMGRGRQPAPLAAAQLVHMRQEDISRLHDDDDDSKSAAQRADLRPHTPVCSQCCC